MTTPAEDKRMDTSDSDAPLALPPHGVGVVARPLSLGGFGAAAQRFVEDVWTRRYRPTPVDDPASAPRATMYVSMSFMPAFRDMSVEELRVRHRDTIGGVGASCGRATLLERHTRSAIQRVVLDQPQWWKADRERVWAPWLQQVATHVITETVRETAARAVLWLEPMATRVVERSGDASVAPCLSELLVEWPERDATSQSGDADVSEDGRANEDAYLRLVRVELRQVCEQNLLAWPQGWGRRPCSCVQVRSLIDLVTSRCMVEVARLHIDTASISRDSREIEEYAHQVLVAMDDEEVTGDGAPASPRVRCGPMENSLVCDIDPTSAAAGMLTRIFASDAIFPEPEATASFMTRLRLDDDNAMSHLTTVADTNPAHEVAVLLVAAFTRLIDTMLIQSANECARRHFEMPGPGKATWWSIPRRPTPSMHAPMTRPSGEFTVKGIEMMMTTRIHAMHVAAASCASDPWTRHRREDITTDGDVIASGIFIATMKNVASFHIQFRDRSCESFPSHMDSLFFVRPPALDLPSDLQATSLRCDEGRCVVFPPDSEYCLGPTVLVDADEPGRVVMVLFDIINPSRLFSPLTPQEIPHPQETFAVRLPDDDVNLSIEESRWLHYSVHKHPDEVQYGTPPAWVIGQPESTVPRRVWGFTPFCYRSGRKLTSSHSKGSRSVSKMPLLNGAIQDFLFGILNDEEGLDWRTTFQRRYISERLAKSIKRVLRREVASALTRSAAVDKRSNTSVVTPSEDAFRSMAWFIIHAAMLSRISVIGALEPVANATFRQDLCTRASPMYAAFLQKYIGLEDRDEKDALVRALVGADNFNARMLNLVEPRVDALATHLNQLDEYMNRLVHHYTSADGDMITEGSINGSVLRDRAVRPSLKAKFVEECSRLSDGVSVYVSDLAQTRVLVDSCVKSASFVEYPLFSVPRSYNRSVIEQVEGFAGLSGAAECLGHEQARIPSDVEITTHGQVRFLSYIHNLDPFLHRGLYSSIAEIVRCFIPMLDQVFWPSPTVHRDSWTPPLEQVEGLSTLCGRVIQIMVEIEETVQAPAPSTDSRFGWMSTRHVMDASAISSSNIVATGIFVARKLNLTTPLVRLRQPGRFQTALDPRDKGERIPLVEDRCVVVLGPQSQSNANHPEVDLDTFELEDPAKPGSLLLMKIHVVDPATPLVSTANVPPMHHAWYVTMALGDLVHKFGLPRDVQSVLESMLEWPDMGYQR